MLEKRYPGARVSHNTVMVAVCSTAYSVPIFQEKGGFGNPVPNIHLVLEVRRQVPED